jgi:hypothetical protein
LGLEVAINSNQLVCCCAKIATEFYIIQAKLEQESMAARGVVETAILHYIFHPFIIFMAILWVLNNIIL